MARKSEELLDALKEAYGSEVVELLQSFLAISNPVAKAQLLKLAKSLADEAGMGKESNGSGS